MTLTARALSPSRWIVLHDIDWDFYEQLLRRVAQQHVFVTYNRGTLELMSPTYPHDRASRLFFMLVHVLAEELGTPIISAGTTTWRRKSRKAGLEADESFYLKHSARMRGKRKIDLRHDPPPDLAIEVEPPHGRSADERLRPTRRP